METHDDMPPDAHRLDGRDLFWLAALARAGNRHAWRDYLFEAIGGILERSDGFVWAW